MSSNSMQLAWPRTHVDAVVGLEFLEFFDGLRVISTIGRSVCRHEAIRVQHSIPDFGSL